MVDNLAFLFNSTQAGLTSMTVLTYDGSELSIDERVWTSTRLIKKDGTIHLFWG